jgi:predicted anti-sigma-YlaC factor YlaD
MNQTFFYSRRKFFAFHLSNTINPRYMNCSKSKKHFIFRIEGGLPAEKNRELEQHLSVCPDCKALYNKMESTIKLIPGEKRNNPNPFFFSRIEQQLSLLKEIPAQRKPVMVRIMKPALLTMLVAVSIFLGILVGGINSQEEVTQATSNPVISELAGQYQLGTSNADALEAYYATE